MSDLRPRIDSMYNSDVRGAVALVALLWIAILFVLYNTWPIIPDQGVRIVVLIGAAAVLLFNTAAIAAMITHYRADKDFIYGLDIKNADASRNRKS
jgi:uncharacterized membrane protein